MHRMMSMRCARVAAASKQVKQVKASQVVLLVLLRFDSLSTRNRHRLGLDSTLMQSPIDRQSVNHPNHAASQDLLSAGSAGVR